MKIKIPVVLALLALALTTATHTGCALLSPDSTPEARVTDVKMLCYAAASIGTSAALQENPDWLPKFELAYNDLNQLVEKKVVTGLLLRTIVDSLPVKELKSQTARIAIDSAVMLYDYSVGDRVNLEASPYVLAAATGIRDGMRVALGK